MKKYLVTGGAGFIGSHLVDKLIQQNNKVVVIDNLSTGIKENLNPRAELYEIDVQDRKISEIFKEVRPDVVFHFAAQIDVRKSVADPVESAKINVLGTINILENCKNFGVKKIVFSSSGGAAYGEAKSLPTPEDYSPHPCSPYGIEKLAAEYYLDFYKKEYGLDYIILRFANVYGPRQNSKGEAGIIGIFCDKFLHGQQPIINGDGKQTRDFVFVQDVVEANVLGIEKNISGTFNIGTSKETDMNAIFNSMKKIFSLEMSEVHGPEKQGEQKRSCLDFKKAKKEIGWKPEFNLEDGLRETIEWYRKNGK